uniref:Uncharacterized protein n=1 Tax=Kalanchoe fedtschenkoi TaxID=63787 RepID=A0A7N0U469_KALFE
MFKVTQTQIQLWTAFGSTDSSLFDLNCRALLDNIYLIHVSREANLVADSFATQARYSGYRILHGSFSFDVNQAISAGQMGLSFCRGEYRIVGSLLFSSFFSVLDEVMLLSQDQAI